MKTRTKNSFVYALILALSLTLLYARYLAMQNSSKKQAIDYMEKYVIDEKLSAHDSMIQLQIEVWQLQDSITNILEGH